MAGHSPSKTGVNAPCPSHPRLACWVAARKTWMPATRAGMTLDRVIQSQRTMPSCANLDQPNAPLHLSPYSGRGRGTARPAETATRSTRTSPPCMISWRGGRRTAGRSTGPAALCACTGWRSLIGKMPLPLLSGPPPTRRRPTNEPGASGPAFCGTRRSTNRVPSRWTSSSGAKVGSTPVPVGSRGAWGVVIDPEPQDRECGVAAGEAIWAGGAGWRRPPWRLLPQERV
jgi:hypothetical protein